MAGDPNRNRYVELPQARMQPIVPHMEMRVSIVLSIIRHTQVGLSALFSWLYVVTQWSATINTWTRGATYEGVQSPVQVLLYYMGNDMAKGLLLLAE